MKLTDCFDFNKQLSLYIHIPFCTKKCSYCAFFSKVCSDSVKQNYTDRIVSEINEISGKTGGAPFYTAYIGGGNPGCLTVSQLKSIAEAVCRNGKPAEFTTEMNPENLTENHFPLFEKYFTRLSMGVQSLNGKALDFLGRNSSLEETVRGIEFSQRLRKKTGALLNYDIITCLPDCYDSDADLTGILQYNPEHISLYALTLEEGTKLYEIKPELPDSDEQSVILSRLWNKLENSGYRQYEVSNFAKDGNISLHNSVYWDYRQYLGLGCGAASTGFVDGKTYRVDASKNVDIWEYDIQSLTSDEALEEFVLMGLRHTKGLDLTRLETDFGMRIKKLPKSFSEENGFLIPDSFGLMTADRAALELLSGGLYRSSY